MRGYRRANGQIGIRNHVAVVYTVKCAEHVARKICEAVKGTQVFGYDSCYPDPYGYRIVAEMTKHPNVSAVLLISLGCESSPIAHWMEELHAVGKPVELVTIQKIGGTLPAIAAGIRIAEEMTAAAGRMQPVPFDFQELIIGVECGGSDATSGLAANPAVGHTVDTLIDSGARCIFSELPELLGTDDYLLSRASDNEVREKVADGLRRAKALSNRLKTFAVSAGNECSGLTTIEEKSLGALCKSGSRVLTDVLKPGQRPTRSGLYLLDKVGDPESNQLTVYEENDNDGFAALLASGAQIIIFTTGCGNVIGSVIAPVIKVCGNPRQTAAMRDDFDIDAGPVILGRETPEQIGEKLVACVQDTCGGMETKAEHLGHKEFHILRKFSRCKDVCYL